MSKTPVRIGFTIGVLLVFGLAAPSSGIPAESAAPGTSDYTITVDQTRSGPEISESMYGVFYEDINRAADGGLYAELVQNRSFEYSPIDNGSYTPMTSWTTVSSNGGAGSVEVVNDAARLHERNRNYLRVTLANKGDDASFGVTNSSYNTGIALRSRERYDFAVWARTDSSEGTGLSVQLRDAEAGVRHSGPLAVMVRNDEWTKYTGTLTATSGTTSGRLSVQASGTGTLRLDMVSLFPRDTFKGRENGLRRDLAEKVEALQPSFVRFPGGCLVNTGSHEAYNEASGFERARSYQWKDTVGPVETRATNKNFWGYNQSYGLGYFEYFQFSEDIGAMALPVVPALVTGCGQNRATDDPALLQRHIQDTLDLIEFANGPVTSEWGGLRADMGHPAPFGLTHVAVGNEENLPDEYFANFRRFRAAIAEEYPEITVISNSGPDDQGTTFERLWDYNRADDVDMVDEHYYNSPTWFLQNNDRYDAYDRDGPDVFLGEYASLDNRLFNSLAEAAYMTGLERNADIVKMASYAPLLANIDYVQWHPDMIWFDNDQSWGSTSYEVQKLFMNNVGDEVVPSEQTGDVVQPSPIRGAVALSTWATDASYDDITVTAADGTELFRDDFSAGDDQWTRLSNRGTWSVADGAYRQSDTDALNTMVMAGDPSWSDYDLHLKATKNAGAEGFLIGFGVKDSDNYYWWNLGGWNNTQGAVEKSTNGGKETLLAKPNTIEAGHEYDIRIEVRGTEFTLFLDGEEWASFSDDAVTEPFAQVVTRDTVTGDLIVKVVNAQATPAETTLDLGTRRVHSRAEMTVISGDPNQVNTRSAQPIKPVTTTINGVKETFRRTFEPYSVTFIRIHTK